MCPPVHHFASQKQKKGGFLLWVEKIKDGGFKMVELYILF